MASLRSIRSLCTAGGMWGFDPKSIGPWAWGREDAGATAAEATPVEVAIRVVEEVVIPAGEAEGIQEEAAAIREVAGSSRKVVSRARRKERHRQMPLLSSTRCWTSWEPSFQ